MKSKKFKIVAALLCVMLLSGCGKDRAYTLEELTGGGEAAEEAAETGGSGSPQTPEEPPVIYVYVCGQVKSPGVVILEEGSRAADALEAAGGMTEEADESYVNLAQRLTDGQRLYFPSKEETEKEGLPAFEEEAAGGTEPGKVNLNTAGLAELQTLPGIGESKAKAILEYREQHGGFEKPEDLMQVSGIGEASYKKLEAYIIVP